MSKKDKLEIVSWLVLIVLLAGAVYGLIKTNDELDLHREVIEDHYGWIREAEERLRETEYDVWLLNHLTPRLESFWVIDTPEWSYFNDEQSFRVTLSNQSEIWLLDPLGHMARAGYDFDRECSLHLMVSTMDNRHSDLPLHILLSFDWEGA